MLYIPPGETCFVCRCDKCGAEEYTDEADLEDARMVMRGGGWFEMARSGKPAEKWQWQCKTCGPKSSAGHMPSTP